MSVNVIRLTNEQKEEVRRLAAEYFQKVEGVMGSTFNFVEVAERWNRQRESEIAYLKTRMPSNEVLEAQRLLWTVALTDLPSYEGSDLYAEIEAALDLTEEYLFGEEIDG